MPFSATIQACASLASASARFLVLAVILGAFVLPWGYERYQQWQARRNGQLRIVQVQFNSVVDVAKVLDALFELSGPSATTSLNVEPVAESNAIVLRGEPDTVLLAEQIILQMEAPYQPAPVAGAYRRDASPPDLRPLLREMFEPETTE